MTPKKVDLLQGTVDLVLLKLLQAGPAHGWELTQSIQAITKGILDANYGTIYPALRRLEDQEWVHAWWGTSDNNRRARFYELTDLGRRQLRAERTQWRKFAHALDLILGAD